MWENRKDNLYNLQCRMYIINGNNKLKESPYYDRLIFISNEENFKQVLRNHEIEYVFVDRFAGDFGHCTEEGKILIAKNVAETILKLYN